MIKTNLILIDGLPGSGKSVTAQILCLHLRRLRHDAEWFFEHGSSHPVYKYDDPEKIFDPVVMQSQDIPFEALANWQKLVDRLRGSAKITILESTFFQTTIGWLQLMDTDRNETLRFVSQIAQKITGANPVLVYLYQDDVSKSFRRICKVRGEWFQDFLVSRIARTPYGHRNSVSDLEGVIAFYEKVRSITDELYSMLPMQKVAVETSGQNWTEYHRKISQFLEIPTIDPVFQAPDGCSDFVGRYRELNSGNEIGIGCDHEGLYFEEPGHPRLFHNEGSTFSIEGMCIQFSFQTKRNGAATEIEAYGDLPGAAGHWVRIGPASRGISAPEA